MKKIDIEELKSIQLETLNDIHNFCVTNQIKYWLAYGTLIGAIRHNGYIPWDDDIDIAMPREDYEKFIKSYKNKNSVVYSCSNNKDYILHFAKVYDTRTILNEYANMNIETGVYVDVFPIDNIPDSKEQQDQLCRKISFYRHVLFLKKNHILGYGRNFFKTIAFAICKIIVWPVSAHSIAIKINNLLQAYRTENTNYGSCMTDALICKIKKPYQVQLHKFEDYLFYIPNCYDEWLTDNYGDYMTPPLESERKSTHIFEAWWKDEA